MKKKLILAIIALSGTMFMSQAQTVENDTVKGKHSASCVFFSLFSFLPLWLHYNLNPLCVQY